MVLRVAAQQDCQALRGAAQPARACSEMLRHHGMRIPELRVLEDLPDRQFQCQASPRGRFPVAQFRLQLRHPAVGRNQIHPCQDADPGG